MDCNSLYWLDDVISCLGILLGVGGAIFLLTRRKTVPTIPVLEVLEPWIICTSVLPGPVLC